MSAFRNGALLACVTAALGLLSSRAPSAQARGTLATIVPGSIQELRAWDTRTQSMLRSGELRMRQVREDTLLPGHTVERADQYYRGVRVHGADISRQLDGQGVVQSIYGNVYDGIDIRPDPRLAPDEVRARIAALAGTGQDGAADPELVVLPRDEGDFRLAWRMRAVTAQVDIVQYFLDATSGDVLLQYSDRQSQSAVGRAAGVLGDSKKISVTGSGSSFTARDLLRPPVIETEDMKGDPIRTAGYLNGSVTLDASDLASTTDNKWTDVRGGRCARLCGLHLRLLLQTLRPARSRQQQHPDPQPRQSGAAHAGGPDALLQFVPGLLRKCFLRRQRRDGLRRRAAARDSRSAARRGTTSRARSTSSRTS